MQRLKNIFSKKKPDHIPILEFRYYSLFRVVYTLAWLSHASFALLFFVLGASELFYIQFLSLGIFTFTLFLNEKRRYFTSVAIGTAEVILHQALCVYMLGKDMQFQMFVILCAMLPFMLPKGKYVLKTLLLMSIILSYILIFYVVAKHEPIYKIDPAVVHAVGVANILITGLFLGVFGMYFAKAMAETEDELELERQKSDKLLHNILPPSIAGRLKDHNEIIADGFDSVSVLFADIVGFTELSAKLSPEDLVNNLNELFSYFDALVDKYGLEKIKTIGDSYMVSAGLPDSDPQHYAKMANLALDMRQYMSERTSETLEPLAIRIGIHSGPAVAGVIGIKKFTYDLWGDTVNTANRMESHGIPGKIHVSQEFWQETKEGFDFEKRGAIHVKGKGEMETFFLLGRK